MEIISLLLAVGVWLIIRMAAKNGSKCPEFIEESLEVELTNQPSVISHEKKYLKYTVAIITCLSIFSILIIIMISNSGNSQNYIFNKFRYIFIFKKLYFITIENF